MDIQIPASRVPVLAEADVLVCGGGCAGVTAAVAAARHGARVVLLERWAVVGGMATIALVNIWHRSDREKMVIRGLAEESAERLRARGWWHAFGGAPAGQHETEWFDPEGLKVVWEALLAEAGVRVLCGLVAGEPIMDGARPRGVLCDTKTGRRAVLARYVIDATGDGDVAAKAGLPFEYGRASDGRVQGMTLMYRMLGINEAERRAMTPEQKQAIAADMQAASRAGDLPPYNFAFSPTWVKDGDIPNMCPVAGNPLDEEELTRLGALARTRVHQFMDFYRRRVPGFAAARIFDTGYSLGIRESRRVRGRKTLDHELVLGAVKQPDALGHGVWMVDIHDPRGSGYTTWADRGPRNMVPAGQSYHLPYGMCVNDRVPNLAVVGRCASSTHEGHSSMRVQSHCMVLGQGVGTAAALALAAGSDFPAVDLPALQAALRRDGVYLEDVPREQEKQGSQRT